MTTDSTFLGLPWYPERIDLTSVTCAHCGCEARDYRYQIHSCHAQFMLALQAVGRSVVKKELQGLSKSAYNTGTQVWRWNLLQSEKATNRGPWFITEAGEAFMAGRLLVPRYAVVHMRAGQKSPLLRFEGEPINFEEASHTHVDDAIYDSSVAELRDARQSGD